MTTGRINQVTTFHSIRPYSPIKAFPSIGVRQRLKMFQIRLQHIHGFCRGILTVSGPAIEPPCHRSHIFQTHFSLSLFQTDIMAYDEDYQQPASYTEISCSVAADLQVYSCKGALPSARNPHPNFITSKHHKGVMLEQIQGIYHTMPIQSCPSQCILVSQAHL